MRKYIEYIVLFLFLLSCSSKVEILTGDSQYQPFAPDGIPFVVADSMWNVDMRGNHRAVVRVSDINSNTAVKAVLPWRRPDWHRNKECRDSGFFFRVWNDYI